MQQAVEGESLSRPWMGIWYTALTPVIQDQRGLLLGYGALIEPPEEMAGSAVFEGSPADLAGLRDGDIITHVDGIKVDGDNPLDEILTQYRPRETLSLRVLRGDGGHRPPDGAGDPPRQPVGARPQQAPLGMAGMARRSGSGATVSRRPLSPRRAPCGSPPRRGPCPRRGAPPACGHGR